MPLRVLPLLALVPLSCPAAAADLACALEIGSRYSHDGGAWTREDDTSPLAFTLKLGGDTPVLVSPELGSDTADCVSSTAAPVVRCEIGGIAQVVVNTDKLVFSVIDYEGFAQPGMAVGALTGFGSCKAEG